jgi:hypothetical protein
VRETSERACASLVAGAEQLALVACGECDRVRLDSRPLGTVAKAPVPDMSPTVRRSPVPRFYAAKMYAQDGSEAGFRLLNLDAIAYVDVIKQTNTVEDNEIKVVAFDGTVFNLNGKPAVLLLKKVLDCVEE